MDGVLRANGNGTIEKGYAFLLVSRTSLAHFVFKA
jgi:hypothetical protein